MKTKRTVLVVVLGVGLAWITFRAAWTPELREPDGSAAARLPPTAELGRAGSLRPAEPLLEPDALPNGVSERLPPPPLPGDGVLHAVLASDYEPLAKLAAQLVERETGAAAGAVQKTYDRASWSELAPGRYRLRAWADGWEPAAQDVELAAGGAEVRLPMRPLHAFAGHVVDRHDGRPVTGFLVQVELRAREGAGRAWSVWPARELHVRSDAGRFALGGAPSRADELRLVVSAEGYLATATDWYPARAWLDQLVVELGRAGLAESFVTATAVHSGTGAPVPGAKLILVAPNAGMDSVQILRGDARLYAGADVTDEVLTGGARAETDGAGRGRIATRYEGAARMLVVPPALQPLLTEPFELRHGSTTDLGTLLVDPGGAIAGQVWIGDQPALRIVPSVDVTREAGATFSTRLDADGLFRVDGLEPGFYRVAVSGEFAAPGGTGSVVVPVTTASVHVAGLETQYVELHCGSGLGGSSLRGRVEPIEGIDELRVVLLDVDLRSVRMTLAEPDGAFLLTDVPDGDYTLAAVGRNAAMDRFAATWVPVSSPDAASAPLEVRLARSRVEIHARGAAGGEFDATARTQNALFDQLVAEVVRGSLDANGLGVVWGLPAGTYRFRTPRGEREVAIGAEGGTFRIGM